MKQLSLVLLIIALSSNALAGLFFNAPGASEGTVDVIEGDTLTIDIDSDSGPPFMAYLDCDGADITDPIIRPAAGSGGYVMPWPDPELCLYELVGDEPGPVVILPGPAFTFMLVTEPGYAGESYTLRLLDETMTITLDTLVVNVIEADCISVDASFYDDWVEYGKPDCWCYQRQCRGDYNGASAGAPFTGIQWVTVSDLTGLLNTFNVYEPGGVLNSGPGVLSIDGGNGICADFNHVSAGTSFSGIQRVTVPDLNIMLEHFNRYEPGGIMIGFGIPVCPLAGADGDILYYTN